VNGLLLLRLKAYRHIINGYIYVSTFLFGHKQPKYILEKAMRKGFIKLPIQSLQGNHCVFLGAYLFKFI
jgi:hypothetical protein